MNGAMFDELALSPNRASNISNLEASICSAAPSGMVVGMSEDGGASPSGGALGGGAGGEACQFIQH